MTERASRLVGIGGQVDTGVEPPDDRTDGGSADGHERRDEARAAGGQQHQRHAG